MSKQTRRVAHLGAMCALAIGVLGFPLWSVNAQTLETMSGTSSATSQAFIVSASGAMVKYGFSCSNVSGGSGSFALAVENAATGATVASVSRSGYSGAGSVSIPSGGKYTVVVTTGCRYEVAVSG